MFIDLTSAGAVLWPISNLTRIILLVPYVLDSLSVSVHVVLGMFFFLQGTFELLPLMDEINDG